MKNLSIWTGFVLIAFLHSFASLAVEVTPEMREAFEALKTEAVSYEAAGQICEQVARLQLRGKFAPPQYEIHVGVEYRVQGQSIGELDLVIRDQQSQKVVLVGEVKCWKSLEGALEKAQEQRARFLQALRRKGISIQFDAKEGGTFEASDFQGVAFISISQAGGTGKGFDEALPFDLYQLKELRTLMLRCQSQGPCPKP